MALNLMSSAHKATNENYRRQYDKIFRQKKKEEKDENKRKDHKGS